MHSGVSNSHVKIFLNEGVKEEMIGCYFIFPYKKGSVSIIFFLQRPELAENTEDNLATKINRA